MSNAGSRIRAARRARGMSLRALAEKVGVSASMLSLLENGRSRSSVRTLYAVVEALDMSLDELFTDQETPSSPRPSDTPERTDLSSSEITVVRAANRRRIEMETGVIWEQLGRNGNDGIEFMLVIYPPGAKSTDSGKFQRHSGFECAHIMQGELICRVTFEEVTLTAGDSITFDSSRPHMFENCGTAEVRAVWMILHQQPAGAIDPAAAAFPITHRPTTHRPA